jgi:hypothetical protein
LPTSIVSTPASPCTTHHVGRAAASREGNNQVGLALVEHPLVADRSSLRSEPVPVRHIDGAEKALGLGLFGGERVGTARPTGDDMSNAARLPQLE